MAMVLSMRFSLFPCRGLESLLSLFHFRIQFILWLGCVPFQSLHSTTFMDGLRFDGWVHGTLGEL